MRRAVCRNNVAPFGRGPALQKFIDFGARRRAHQAAEARAFDRGGGAGKAHGFDHVAGFDQAQGEGAVERVAGAERIDGFRP